MLFSKFPSYLFIGNKRQKKSQYNFFSFISHEISVAFLLFNSSILLRLTPTQCSLCLLPVPIGMFWLQIIEYLLWFECLAPKFIY